MDLSLIIIFISLYNKLQLPTSLFMSWKDHIMRTPLKSTRRIEETLIQKNSQRLVCCIQCEFRTTSVVAM